MKLELIFLFFNYVLSTLGRRLRLHYAKFDAGLLRFHSHDTHYGQLNQCIDRGVLHVMIDSDRWDGMGGDRMGHFYGMIFSLSSVIIITQYTVVTRYECE